MDFHKSLKRFLYAPFLMGKRMECLLILNFMVDSEKERSHGLLLGSPTTNQLSNQNPQFTEMKANFKLRINHGILSIDLEELGFDKHISFNDLCDEQKELTLNAIRNSVKDLIVVTPV